MISTFEVNIIWQSMAHNLNLPWSIEFILKHEDVLFKSWTSTNRDFDQHIWKKVFEAGQSFGIKPIGLAARDTLRLEKGFCLYGNDIDDTTSPLEAGLGWITKFSKSFTNSENLLKQKENGVTTKLVGFELLERGIPRHDYEIVNKDGNKIGRVSSGTQSPSLQKPIGMGYVETSYSQIDSEIFIRIRNKDLKAKVVKMPFL
jgi:aminomethyltransferase